MRHLLGVGTPRGLQGRVAAVIATLLALISAARRGCTALRASKGTLTAMRGLTTPTTLLVNSSAATTCVAVGTTVTRRPPHRTVRAGLLHTAPTLDE